MKTISFTAPSGTEIRFVKLGFGSVPLDNLDKAMELASSTTIPIVLSEMLGARFICVRRALSASSTR